MYLKPEAMYTESAAMRLLRGGEESWSAFILNFSRIVEVWQKTGKKCVVFLFRDVEIKNIDA